MTESMRTFVTDRAGYIGPEAGSKKQGDLIFWGHGVLNKNKYEV